jgi:hypothetical protein
MRNYARTFILVTAAMLVAVATPVPAQQATWVGQISDSLCGLKHEEEPYAGGGRQEKLTPHQCTLACINGGSKFVLATEEALYVIADQKDPLLVKYAGETVKVTGELKDKVLTVSKIEMP